MNTLCAPWGPDGVLPGFEARTLRLRDDGDQPVATLVRRCRDGGRNASRALLYLHGFNDYFFQAHLAEAYAEHGYDVYALDLRRYGRSLRPGQVPFQCRSLDDHFEEITAALDIVAAESTGPVVVNAHSTGGLIAALYAHRGARRERLAALVLNSPFLAQNVGPVDRALLPVVVALGRVAPGARVTRMSSVYSRSLHRDHGGEWDFDPAWKRLDRVPVHAGWVRAVVRAQRELQRGLAVACPVLVLRAGTSARADAPDEDVRRCDVVLDTADMARIGPGIGALVTVVAVPDGIHDLVLSRPDVRARALAEQFAWLHGLGLA